MRPRSILTISSSTLLRTSLLVVIVLAGCAPAATPAPTQAAVPVQASATPVAAPVEASPLPAETRPSVAATEALPTEAPTTLPQVAATSRGPSLEATDPSTYTRASGGLQLVEFFAFW